MITLLPLLGKRLDGLTTADFSKIAKVLKLNVVVTEELKEAGLSLLAGQGVNTVSELIQKPESIQQLLGMFAPPQVEEKASEVLRCPHCSLFFIV